MLCKTTKITRFEILMKYAGYALPEHSAVTLKVYDITGRLITTLAEYHQPAGNYDLQWDGHDKAGHSVSSGVYYCSLEAGSFSKTIKMVCLK